MFYNDVNGVFVCFDLTDDVEAFDKVNYWIEDINQNAPANAVKMLCGLKLDLVEPTDDLRRSSIQVRR